MSVAPDSKLFQGARRKEESVAHANGTAQFRAFCCGDFDVFVGHDANKGGRPNSGCSAEFIESLVVDSFLC
jgi:hypothetical protein